MEVKYTDQFNKWFRSLKDFKAKASVLRRIDHIKYNDHFGDYKSIADAADLFELRIFASSGIRIYFTIKNKVLVILLVGGDKSTQNRDIEKAKEILKELK